MKQRIVRYDRKAAMGPRHAELIVWGVAGIIFMLGLWLAAATMAAWWVHR